MKPRSMFAKISSWLHSSKLLVYGIKYIPPISVLLMTIHTALLICGIHEVITIGVSAVLLVCLLILFSIKFRFCALHKALIAYMGVTTLCICLQGEDLLGCMLNPLRLIMLLIGIILSVIAFVKLKDDDCGQ